MLQGLAWFTGNDLHSSTLSNKTRIGPLTAGEENRRLARFEQGKTTLTAQALFRGSTAGAMTGPYLSQFMLVGTGAGEADGIITYGANTISQKIQPYAPGLDYMCDFNSWLDVQLGADVGNVVSTEGKREKTQTPTGHARFITTPRDLARYVHVDQLYQAYLNATLILLETGIQLDPGIPEHPGSHVDASGFPDGTGRPPARALPRLAAPTCSPSCPR